MNERVKQLAEQAWTMVSDEERTRGELYEADKQRERRDQVFAELIVQECQLRVEQYINGCGEVASMPDTVIMKHFGVEE